MSCFQVIAVLASGAQMLFGVQAEDLDAAKIAAGERLPEAGLPVRDLQVAELSR